MTTILYNFFRRTFKKETEAEKKARIIAGIRKEFSLMGFDVSEYTDEDFESMIQQAGNLARATGCTAQQAVDSFKACARLFNSTEQ